MSFTLSISYNSDVDPQATLDWLQSKFPDVKVSIRPDFRDIGAERELANNAAESFREELASVGSPFKIEVHPADEGFKVAVHYSDGNVDAVIRAVLKVCSDHPGVPFTLRELKP